MKSECFVVRYILNQFHLWKQVFIRISKKNLLFDIASAILSSASFSFFTYVAWCLSWCSYKQDPRRNCEEESKEKLLIKNHFCCQFLAGFFRQLRQCVAHLGVKQYPHTVLCTVHSTRTVNIDTSCTSILWINVCLPSWYQLKWQAPERCNHKAGQAECASALEIRKVKIF